ncbi:MAG: alkaline phosphatase [Phycisphaerales bacterium]
MSQPPQNPPQSPSPHDPPPGPTPSRRQFLAGIGATGIAAAAAWPLSAAPPSTTAPTTPSERRAGAPRARNLIFLCSDGMSAGTMGLADLLIQARHNRRSHWYQLIERTRDSDSGVRRALLDTRSANAFVTDSSAAACAWACGELFDNGAMGYTPDGRTPIPILPHARQSGRFVGIATTTRATHATPAGFCCNVPGGRDAEHDIAAQMIERHIDLILGGGRSRFRDLDTASHAYHTLTTRDQLLAFMPTPDTPPRLLGLFAEEHMAYDIDRSSDEAIAREQPSLAEMTAAAIRIADASPAGRAAGFVLQIEGGRVDHAAHANDALALVHDQAAFDDALRVALDFAEQRDDTLIIACTDHANANPGLTDYGQRGIRGFETLINQGRRSFDWAFQQLGREPSLERIDEVVRAATGIALERDELITLHRWRGGVPVDPFTLANKNAGPLGSVLANHTKVAFLSPNHTADPVELTALGPGADRFAGVLTMPDVHAAMVAALGLEPPRPIG